MPRYVTADITLRIEYGPGTSADLVSARLYEAVAEAAASGMFDVPGATVLRVTGSLDEVREEDRFDHHGEPAYPASEGDPYRGTRRRNGRRRRRR